MATHNILDLTAFRAAYPAFSDVVKFPDVMLNAMYQNAGNYISQNDSTSGLNGAMLDYALQLMTAHLLQSSVLIASGQTSAIVTSSSVGSVSVSIMPPPVKSAFGYWLATTAYGQQLRGLLSVQSAGGWSVGGSPERSAFRKVGGMF
ncbi:Protein of unknown function DUF4054 [uncultured Caudovirales phage]|uniref:DUF4054 domain-containing protein n=1 Tax=uncultured Caudovirales phage TaxID=2100421 RepID=A0A6J5LDU1_9CAUD|nr:Protein of unknown function DUF4054 [uncultured Caudovirales phage]